MLLVPVAGSTDILAAGYDPVMGELQIQFNNQRIYSYPAVDPTTYQGFLDAPSKGAFIAQVFRKNPGLYPATRIL